MPDFNLFLQHLMKTHSNTQGFGHYWTKQSKITTWWNTKKIPPTPKVNEDIYFGVHPSKIRKLPNQRPTETDILAINCLYADFDIKTFETAKFTLKHIKSLVLQPSVIISSGGGYHCYWLLSEPFILDSISKKKIAKTLQKKWVNFIQGDLAVHDLARILRIPETLNYKYNPPKPVKIIKQDLSLTYSLIEIQTIIPNATQSSTTEHIPKPKQANDLTEQEIVTLIVNSAEKQLFKKLFSGSDEGYESASEADLAFCCVLVFWTGGDYHKINRIFKASKRMRPKWKRLDYQHETISKALLRVDNYYNAPGGFLTAGAHDEGNATVIAQRTKKELCYCEAFGWLRYIKNHWATELAEPYAEKRIAEILKLRRSAAVKANIDSIVIAAKPNTGNVLRAKTLLKNKLMLHVKEFDTSLDELNCINGVINLKTGKLSKSQLAKHFTYTILTKYNPEANADFWLNWLAEAVNNDQKIIDYLQLALGYSLTGQTREEILFYLYGPERAGKGIFIETIIHMLGERPLATEVDIDLFMNNSSSALFSLAALRVARFVAASESDEKQWLNAKGIKRWTGGNYITCAHKYGKDFTYRPHYKIWLTSNYQPQMDAEDSAAWGRLRVIEFPNSFKGKENKYLKTQMRKPEVLEGILKWCVEGAVKWYKLDKHGLRTPKIIVANTQIAREEIDWVATWVTENIHICTNGKVPKLPSDIYYQDYKDWCINNGVNPKSLRSLNIALRRADYTVGIPTKIGGKTKRCWEKASLQSYTQSLHNLQHNIY